MQALPFDEQRLNMNDIKELMNQETVPENIQEYFLSTYHEYLIPKCEEIEGNGHGLSRFGGIPDLYATRLGCIPSSNHDLYQMLLQLYTAHLPEAFRSKIPEDVALIQIFANHSEVESSQYNSGYDDEDCGVLVVVYSQDDIRNPCYNYDPDVVARYRLIEKTKQKQIIGWSVKDTMLPYADMYSDVSSLWPGISDKAQKYVGVVQSYLEEHGFDSHYGTVFFSKIGNWDQEPRCLMIRNRLACVPTTWNEVTELTICSATSDGATFSYIGTIFPLKSITQNKLIT
ncbi:hypothetical protein PCE1_002773 [Barthelona sp. PCE]